MTQYEEGLDVYEHRAIGEALYTYRYRLAFLYVALANAYPLSHSLVQQVSQLCTDMDEMRSQLCYGAAREHLPTLAHYWYYPGTDTSYADIPFPGPFSGDQQPGFTREQFQQISRVLQTIAKGLGVVEATIVTAEPYNHAIQQIRQFVVRLHVFHQDIQQAMQETTVRKYPVEPVIEEPSVHRAAVPLHHFATRKNVPEQPKHLLPAAPHDSATE